MVRWDLATPRRWQVSSKRIRRDLLARIAAMAVAAVAVAMMRSGCRLLVAAADRAAAANCNHGYFLLALRPQPASMLAGALWAAELDRYHGR